MSCSNPPNCTGWPFNCELTAALPDIAGIGVILAFCINAALTLVASVMLLGRGLFSPVREFLESKSNRETLELLVLGLSDTQLVTAITIAIIAFTKHCTISMYHLAIVGELAWYSANTHLVSMIALREYFKRSPRVLLLFRLIGMGTIFCLLLIFIVWMDYLGPGISGRGVLGRNSCSCPAKCAWKDPQSVFKYLSPRIFKDLSSKDRFYALLAIFEAPILVGCYAICAIPLLRSTDQPPGRWSTSALILQVIAWILATALLCIYRFPRPDPGIVVGSENEWEVGQILPIAIIVLPFFTAISSYLGKPASCPGCIQAELESGMVEGGGGPVYESNEDTQGARARTPRHPNEPGGRRDYVPAGTDGAGDGEGPRAHVNAGPRPQPDHCRSLSAGDACHGGAVARHAAAPIEDPEPLFGQRAASL